MARPALLTAYCLTLVAAAAAAAVVLAARGPTPELVPLLILGALFVLAENLDRVTSSRGFSVSASPMLGMAAIVVFHDTAPLLGPLLVGLFDALDFTHLRRFEWRKMTFNAGNFGLSLLAAAATFGVFAPAGPLRPAEMAALAVPTVLAFSAINLSLVIVVTWLAAGGVDRRELRRDLLGEAHVYPFALLGFFLGQLYLDAGPVVAPLFIAPILIARQTFNAYVALQESHEAALRILIGALEAKDRYTAGHAERVARYAGYIGEELGLGVRRLERLRLAALMHDVGKLVVPNHLLNKPGKLTPAEFAEVRRHEDVSVEILSRIDFLAPVAPSATSEAARFEPVADERGQPIEPHIVAVADAYDAMTSTRSYRRALPQQEAFRELRRNAGRQFHPRVVDALIAALRRRGEVHGPGYEEHVYHQDAPVTGTGSAGLGDLLPDGSAPATPAAGTAGA
jgi:hypothetical protein